MTTRKVLKVSGRPRRFYGTVRLPPSKSYLHRALFVSALASGDSILNNCGVEPNDDIKATLGALTSLGTNVRSYLPRGGTFRVSPGLARASDLVLHAGGSGTTTRFLIPFSALSAAGSTVKIVGNESLSKRPMDAIFEPLMQLGVKAKPLGSDGKLPVVVEGGGIEGGNCEVDGSVSSQFVSSLLISCLKARRKTVVSIKNPAGQVSTPYIDATIRVIRSFGFRIRPSKLEDGRYASFEIPENQQVQGREFSIPGDMSSAAALIGSAMAANGKLRLTNFQGKGFPQPDSAIIPIARKLGASVEIGKGYISIGPGQNKTRNKLALDLRNSPDLVPAIAGLSAAKGAQISISNIGHLRFKESDRISVLSRELSKVGIETQETETTLTIFGTNARTTTGGSISICPEGDHRMLMALTIVGLSGRFGHLYIEDPDCVKKSYPSFVSDLQKLCHDKTTLKLVNLRVD